MSDPVPVFAGCENTTSVGSGRFRLRSFLLVLVFETWEGAGDGEGLSFRVAFCKLALKLPAGFWRLDIVVGGLELDRDVESSRTMDANRTRRFEVLS